MIGEKQYGFEKSKVENADNCCVDRYTSSDDLDQLPAPTL